MKPLQHQTSLDVAGRNYLSLVMRKSVICICENKDADQLRGNREADQRICFRYMASTIPLLPKPEISSLKPSSVLFYTITLNMKPLQHQTSLDVAGRNYLSLVMRKPVIYICDNKDADQLRGNREADQRICFCYTASTIPLLPKP